MHVMQAALFRAPEEEAAMKAASRPPQRRKLSVFAGLSQKRGRDSEGEGLRTELRQVRIVANSVEPHRACGAGHMSRHHEPRIIYSPTSGYASELFF